VQDRLVATAHFARLRGGSLTAQTLLEATELGWWYATRLPGDRVLTMLVTEPGEVKALAADGFAAWKSQLAATRLLAPRLAAVELEGESFSHVPIWSSLLEPLEGERWLAIGDAAACYDPLSSQGIFKALTDAGEAAAHIAAALGQAPAPSEGRAERLRARFDDYLRNRAYLYAREQRWPDAPFWAGRASSPEGGPRETSGG
jgi:flavin-dependent dehydrogenase